MLLISYAEDEKDVEGSVNGVTKPAAGKSTHTHLLFIHTNY